MATPYYLHTGATFLSCERRHPYSKLAKLSQLRNSGEAKLRQKARSSGTSIRASQLRVVLERLVQSAPTLMRKVSGPPESNYHEWDITYQYLDPREKRASRIVWEDLEGDHRRRLLRLHETSLGVAQLVARRLRHH